MFLANLSTPNGRRLEDWKIGRVEEWKQIGKLNKNKICEANFTTELPIFKSSILLSFLLHIFFKFF
jgi:hypothetical protein